MTSALNILSYSASLLMIGVMLLAVLGFVSITLTIGFCVTHWYELDRSVRTLVFISSALLGFVLYRIITP